MSLIGDEDVAAIGLTRHTLAFEEGGEVFYNHLCAPSEIDGRIAFMSIANHPKHAKAARVSMRAVFALAPVSRLACQYGGLDYRHDVGGLPIDFTF